MTWAALLIFWPVSDALRKWGGLNQPLYVLQLLAPSLALFFLWRKRCLRLYTGIVFPCVVLAFTTGIGAILSAFSGRDITYLGVWFLNLSALIGPPLLLCAASPSAPLDPWLIKRFLPRLIAVFSLLLLANSVLMVLQSVLGGSHPLSVGAGGVLDAQIGTNTSIQIRAPGLFTFTVAAGLFAIHSSIFLLSTFGKAPTSMGLLGLRYVALLSMPVALIRSISRHFLFSSFVVFAPFVPQLFRLAVALRLLAIFLLILLLSFLLPDLRALVLDGANNFSLRLVEAGGFFQGILVRFYGSLFSDAAGSDASLLGSFLQWFDEDPLSACFGFGLGYSSPLYRYVQGYQDTSYGFVSVGGRDYLVGETALPSLLADVGMVNLLFAVILFLNIVILFFRRFRPFSFRGTARALMQSSFFLILVPFNQVYFRPSSVFPAACAMLLPIVLCFLESSSKSSKAV